MLVGGNTKNFRPANKSQEDINKFLQSTQFKLPTTENLFLKFEMEHCIAHHKHFLKLNLEELQQQ